jgi:hypothetical protein
MEVVSAGPATALDSQTSGVSWAAIAAGAVAAAALTLMLVAFGAGLGLSAVSPWADSGVSATTFKVGSGIYLVIVAVMASSIGGYLAARLRTKWTGLHTNEVFFRDTAHGLLAWAFGTLITFGVLGAAITHIGSGAAAGVSGAATAQAAQNASPADLYVDKLFRPAASPAAGAAVTLGAQPTAGNPDTSRSEVSRLWTSSFSANNDLSAEDRTYVARVVAARTGLSQQEAEKRVNDVIVEAKAAADKTRKAAAQLALWLTASMLFGAFAASLAAVEGGQLRDGTWNGRVLTALFVR